jgi:hypothetical protein
MNLNEQINEQIYENVNEQIQKLLNSNYLLIEPNNSSVLNTQIYSILYQKENYNFDIKFNNTYISEIGVFIYTDHLIIICVLKNE